MVSHDFFFSKFIVSLSLFQVFMLYKVHKSSTSSDLCILIKCHHQVNHNTDFSQILFSLVFTTSKVKTEHSFIPNNVNITQIRRITIEHFYNQMKLQVVLLLSSTHPIQLHSSIVLLAISRGAGISSTKFVSCLNNSIRIVHISMSDINVTFLVKVQCLVCKIRV